ncbi:RNA-binding E3 ubiquitin-protein ligase MEX3C [Chamaea fasciata]|uniref:RNA-binding E3 ubiquitin-protein ligase MEX3C n=1 Tax=Chamaea fasciata TaxID=190680 RepID=UPI003369E8F1
MPSGAASTDEPALLLLQQRLQELGLRRPGAPEPPGEEQEEGEAELREDEDEDEEDDAPFLPPAFDGAGGRSGVAALLAHTFGGAAALSGGRSVNTTECVAVPSSEHVAEIVGRQGCKIKALRAKTNTYIKTPVRGEEPVFVVTGRREDVAAAKREILSAAEHFSLLRASRGKGGPSGAAAAALPGQTTLQVRVPYRVVGLVVGPKGATVKRIQQQTHTYIVTPSRDREPVFEVTGTPENVDRARREIETHIAVRTGAFLEPADGGGFRADGTDGGFERGAARPRLRAGTVCGRRNGSSSSLGSGSTDSCLGGGRPPDFSPSSPGAFWFGEALPPAGAEEPPLDSPVYDPLPAPSPTIWAPFEPPCGAGAVLRGSRPPTPRPSPAFSEGPERPPGPGLPPVRVPAFSNGTDSCSSSNGGSASSSPPESRRRRCAVCFEGDAAAAPCGHRLLCPPCALRICGRAAPACPLCRAAVARAVPIRS